MRVLAIDPGTHSLGWALYEAGRPVADGLWCPEWESPLDYLRQLENLLATLDPDQHGRPQFDTLATEAMFLSFRRGAKSAALLNVSVDQMRAWCKAQGVAFHSFANGTVKKVVTGDGGADKSIVRRQTIHLVSEATRREINGISKAAIERRKLLENVTDAHAIGQTAIVKLANRKP